ncbi:MAG: EthD family reductase [Steroidobacteraceae bacterium]
MVLMKRKPGIAHDEFARHMYEYGLLAGKVLRPWLRGYIQDLAVALEGAGEPAVDGVDELYLDDWQSLQAMRDFFTSDAAAVLRKEQNSFLHAPATMLIPVRQKFMVKPSGGIKIIALLKRKQGTTHEHFSRHWEDIHGPLCTRLLPWFTGYVQDHCMTVPGGSQPALDGLDEMWVADQPSWQSLFSFHGSDHGKPIRDDEAKFLDTASVGIFLVEQRYIIGDPLLEATSTDA